MAPDKHLLREFQKAIHLHKGKDVVDMDQRIKLNFNFYIDTFENIFRNTEGRVPPNKWSYHRIGLVTAGSPEFTSGIYKSTAPKNTFIFIPAHMITSSKNWDDSCRGFVILFNTEFFVLNGFPAKTVDLRPILSYAVQPFMKIEQAEADFIESCFKTIIDEHEENRTEINEMLAIKTLELIIHYERIHKQFSQLESLGPSLGLVKRFIDGVETNFMNDRSVNFYAELLNVHPNYLNSIIKKYTGISAKESIQNRLLMEMKYLLHTTSLTVKEISSRLSFNDANYCSSFFTKAEKISPARYRASFV